MSVRMDQPVRFSSIETDDELAEAIEREHPGFLARMTAALVTQALRQRQPPEKLMPLESLTIRESKINAELVGRVVAHKVREREGEDSK